MPVPDAAKKAAVLMGPIVVKEGPKLARKLVNGNEAKKRAHTMAWERGGTVGQVTFNDGVRRWVVADSGHSPIASVPQYEDGTPETLASALADVDLRRCLGPSDREIKEEKKRAEAARKEGERIRKQEAKAAEQQRRAEEHASKERAKAAANAREDAEQQ